MKSVRTTLVYPNGYTGKLVYTEVERFEIFLVVILNIQEVPIIRKTFWSEEAARRSLESFRWQFLESDYRTRAEASSVEL